MTDKPAPAPVKQALSFDDLTPARVTVVFQIPKRPDFTLSVKTMTYDRWMEFDTLVPDPKVPKKLNDDGEPVDDYQNADYLKKRAEKGLLRNHMRMAEAIDGGAHDDDGRVVGVVLPGDTLEAKAKAVGRIDAGVHNAFWDWLFESVFGGKAALISERADTFRSAQPDEDAGTGTDGDAEPERVGEPA